MSNALQFAVVVGIDVYRGPGLEKLAGPVNDARAVHDWLVDPAGGGLPSANVRLVISDPASADPRPLQTQIDDALIEVNTLAAKATDASAAAFAASRLILYVAGHGIMPGNGMAALLLADARTGALGRNIEMRAYVDWYVRAGIVAEVIVYADCCRNFYPLVRGNPPTLDPPKETNGSVRQLIWYATAANRTAQEDTDPSIPPDRRRGYFTRALVDGLHGKAERDTNGRITARSLLNYVNAAIGAAHGSLAQKVEAIGTLDDIVLGAGAPAPVTLHVTIRFPQGFVSKVELERPDDTRAAWDPAQGDWELDLPPGRYGIVLEDTEDPGPLAHEGLFRVEGADRVVTL